MVPVAPEEHRAQMATTLFLPQSPQAEVGSAEIAARMAHLEEAAVVVAVAILAHPLEAEGQVHHFKGEMELLAARAPQPITVQEVEAVALPWQDLSQTISISVAMVETESRPRSAERALPVVAVGLVVLMIVGT